MAPKIVGQKVICNDNINDYNELVQQVIERGYQPVTPTQTFTENSTVYFYVTLWKYEEIEEPELLIPERRTHTTPPDHFSDIDFSINSGE